MRCSVYALTFFTFAFGAVTVGMMSLAVATDSWLLTREYISDGNVSMWILSRSGLWRVCLMSESNTDFETCMAINYETEGGRDNGAETTMVILGAIRYSVPLPVSALFLSFIAVILNVVGSIHRDVKTLVCAVFYVLAGLALAVGIILYISAINDEVGYRANTKKGEAGFSYQYGWSFFSAGISFISSEMAAVVCVTLYLRRNSKMEDMVKIIPGLEEKVDGNLLRDSGPDGIHNPTVIL